MDAEISAFSMYKTKKSKNQMKKQKKRNKSKSQLNIPPTLTIDEITKQIAQKLKKKQKNAKEIKNLMKKKQHKKKKSRSPKRKEKNNKEKSSDNVPSDIEEVPVLVPAPVSQSDSEYEEQCEQVFSDTNSQSSNDNIDLAPVETNSAEEGLKAFKWMIAPHKLDVFFDQYWEKQPLHITRHKPEYYKKIISTPVIDDMLRKENIQFTKNIDVTSYIDGKRDTHNPEGRAHPHLVWDFYLNGCSIRLLNPQTYISKLHVLNATMQEYFNSFVGANAYLTPPDSQGFAPHYDDIEAFILQAEGKKRWRLYNPINANEVLPRVSSKNFDQNEIGKPMMEIILEAGDMLYFPRGFIHQGVTIDGEHSLHVTISMYQKHSWADLFEKMVPAALQLAINENVELRQGLPFNIYDNFGLVHSDSKTPERKAINKVILSLFDKIKNHLPIDEAVDQMHKNYQHAALPPVLNEMEKAVTVFGDSDVMMDNGKVVNRVEIGLDTKIRLLRKNILRMVTEENIRLYYYIENSLEYHGNELLYLEIEEDLAPAVENLITAYPEYVSVESLELSNDPDKIHIADALWSRGLIMTEFPLDNIDDD